MMKARVRRPVMYLLLAVFVIVSISTAASSRLLKKWVREEDSSFPIRRTTDGGRWSSVQRSGIRFFLALASPNEPSRHTTPPKVSGVRRCQVPNADHIVGGYPEGEHPLHPLQAAMAQLPEPADGLRSEEHTS